MGELINSISFQENTLCWLQMDVEADAQNLTIKRVVESPLPFIINYDNVQKSTTALQIANHLSHLAEQDDQHIEAVRFLISARFGLVKKITLDRHIPDHVVPGLIDRELKSVLTSDLREFLIYQPGFNRSQQELSEVLTIAIRKDFLNYMRRIGQEASLPVSQINLNCFTIDELFRRFFPGVIGQSLLVNFTERGLELIVIDETSFINYHFKPYSKSLHSIEQLEEKDVIATFHSVVENLQRPGIVDAPIYSISQVYMFGDYLNAHWLDNLQNQSSLPLKILNPADSNEWHIVSESQKFNSLEAYRFVEALSNIF